MRCENNLSQCLNYIILCKYTWGVKKVFQCINCDRKTSEHLWLQFPGVYCHSYLLYGEMVLNVSKSTSNLSLLELVYMIFDVPLIAHLSNCFSVDIFPLWKFHSCSLLLHFFLLQKWILNWVAIFIRNIPHTTFTFEAQSANNVAICDRGVRSRESYTFMWLCLSQWMTANWITIGESLLIYWS